MPYIILCSNRALSKYFTCQSCNCSAKYVLRESQKRWSNFRGSVSQDYLFWQFTFGLTFVRSSTPFYCWICYIISAAYGPEQCRWGWPVQLHDFQFLWIHERKTEQSSEFIFDVNRVISGGLFELEFVERVDQQSFTTAGAILGEADLWGLQKSLVDWS